MANAPDQVEQFKADVAAHELRFPRANVGHLVDSIDYAVKLIGIDHVTISSDMEHGGGVTGWMNAGEAFGVTEELLRRAIPKPTSPNCGGPTSPGCGAPCRPLSSTEPRTSPLSSSIVALLLPRLRNECHPSGSLNL